eukprot:CAMPEP_0194534604 /NCGR_PEP_ID=MMETSP0253-20130528/72874_1 /TAXON_ID=2966 /ORGANISM="Noctiluca scintillans" /LENGTH=39 /DNA_ID= /DNA_START= /DNA_END= /DNA_ORIENTATION=
MTVIARRVQGHPAKRISPIHSGSLLQEHTHSVRVPMADC